MAPYFSHSFWRQTLLPWLRQLEKRSQNIPTWLVALVAIVMLCLAIILIRADASLLAWNAPPSARKHVLELLLDDAESIALVLAVILYIKGAPDRRTQKHYEAWRVIDTAAAAGVNTSYARYQALQDLHQDGVSLQWLEAPYANLLGIQLPRANLQGCNLGGANLEQANLRGANLQGANLQGANLSQADLVGCDLTGANLQGANLRAAVLWRAKLWESDLSGAEMRWAEVHREQLSSARLSQTVLPDGSLHPAQEEAIAQLEPET